MQDRKIFIVGGTGFIGQYMVECFIKESMCKVYVVTRRPKSELFIDLESHDNIEWVDGIDISEERVVNNFFRRYASKGDVIINLAKGGGYSWSLKNTITNVHVLGSKNLVAICKELELAYLFFSSASAHLLGYKKTNPYTYTKKQAEDYLTTVKDVDWIIVSPSEALGIGAGGSKIKLFNNVSHGMLKFLDLPGTTNVFDVQECVKVVFSMVDNWEQYNHKNILILGADITYRDFFSMMRDELGVKNKVVGLPKWLLWFLYHSLFWLDKTGLLPMKKYPPHIIKAGYSNKQYSTIQMEKKVLPTNVRIIVSEMVHWYKSKGFC